MNKKVNDALDSFFERGVDPSTRTIYLGYTNGVGEEGEVDGELSKNVIKALWVLSHQSEAPINLIVNNIGGDVQHGLAIMDAMLACRCPITAFVFGQACSMAALILQAATERVISENAILMIHVGKSATMDDHPEIVNAWMNYHNKLDTKMEQMYLARIREKHPNYSLKSVKNLLRFDTILSAEQAVELGLADRILQPKEF